jgi:hypothetical protein
MTYIPDSQTWRDATTYNRLTSLFRSLLYAGTGVDTGDYATEYQEVCENIETYFAPAMDLQGGVGATGPMYETQLQFDRAWLIEGFTVATGVDGWAPTGKWPLEWGKWLVYSLVPHRGRNEDNQDINSAGGGDSYKNVGLMAARGHDPYHQAHNNEYWQEVLTRDISDYRNTSLWCLVLWYDPTLPAYAPSSAPKAVRLGAGGMDHVYMTTGLGQSNPTWACFEAGKYLYGHQHQDAGAFTIHRKGNLIIDSGFYGQYRSVDGDDHASSYYHRSISHNVLHVYDPNEPFYWTSGGGLCVNDGGQVMPSSAPSLDKALNDPTFSPGRMLLYETNESYTYAQADLENAYDQEAISESRNKPFYPNKLTHITREFVFLRPDYFVVFDRVGSVDPDFVKVWNVHVAANPTIQGTGVQRAGSGEAGIWDYAGASVARVTDTDPRYGQGSLFLKCLLPKTRTMRKIGGNNRSYTGYAYWVGGFDQSGRYDPTKGANHYWGDWLAGHEYNENNLADLTIGWGRIEIEATTPANEDLFLNVLYPCDASVGQMPDTRLIESPGMVGAEVVNDRVILFGRSQTIGIDSVSYSVAPNDTSSVHTICNLIASSAYRVYRSGSTVYVRRSTMAAPPGAEEIVTPPPVTTASGLLTFQFSGESSLLLISEVEANPDGESPFSVTITWTTDLASDSRVEYGPTPAYGSLSPLYSSLVTSHTVTLTSPAAENDVTTYYRVLSSAPGGQSGTSDGYSFRFDLVNPGKVSDLRVAE